MSSSSDDVPEPIGHQLLEQPSGEVVLFLGDKHPRQSSCMIKQDPASVEFKVLGEFRSWGKGIVDFCDDCIRGLECKVKGRVVVFNSNPAWLRWAG